MAKRWWLTAVGAACAVLAVVLAVTLWPQGTTRPAAKSTSPPTPVVAPPTPSPTPTPTPTPRPVAIEYVPAAAPTHFLMTGPAAGPHFTIKAKVCGMPNVRPLDPPGEQHHTVCWVDHDFGVAPGSRSATTYILGHAWAEDRLEVLNPASEPSTKQILEDAHRGHTRKLDGITIYPTTVLNGSKIQLRTATGHLTYTVKQVYGVAKSEAGNVRSLMNEKTKNRIVIITCAERNGIDYDYDVIINAYLTGAKRTPSKS